MNVLIVDDEILNIEIASAALEDGYEISFALSGHQALEVAQVAGPDLILLDVMMPGLNGYDLCRLLKQDPALSDVPVIFTTSLQTPEAELLGLSAGAIDYVTKPFRFAVLLARIRAHLRSHEQSEDAVFSIGPYEFRPAAKVLMDAKGKKIRLTEKETNILKYLYRAGAKPVSREELLTEVWGYNAGVTTHTLETHVYRLRQKIERDPSNAEILVTENGGYKIVP